MYFELKSVNVWTMIKVWFFLNLIVGLALGLFYAFFSLMTVAAADELFLLRFGLDPEMFSAGQVLLLLPIAFALGHAIFGTLLVAVLSVVYNITARLVGGLQFEMAVDQDDSEPESAPLPAAFGTAASVAAASPAAPVAQASPREYTPPPPPPPPLGTVGPDELRETKPPFVRTSSDSSVPAAPELDSKTQPTHEMPTVDWPVPPAEHETPTVDWPVPPPDKATPENNDEERERNEL